uniref:TPR_REGION domain-containing protein n=1 Tax=Rhabditophanes sp. KR3021 TaxID=114890 RepID=A0AC35UHD4_9BILA
MVATDFQMISSKYIITILSIASFILSYNGDFVFDDHKAIVQNKVVTANKSSGLNLYELLRTDFWGDFIQSDYSHKSYRPVTTLTFRLNYLIAGLDDTKIYHFTNIIIHAINSNLVARIVKLCFPNSENLALYSGIIFGVHPIGSESVASIVGRAELLMAFFFFLSLQETITHPDKITLKFTLLFVLSFFSKEQGIMILRTNLAIQSYLKAIEFNQEYSHAMNNLANIYSDIGRDADAELLLLRCLNITTFPFPTAWMNLGITQMRLGKYYKSENSLKMALKVSKNANIYFNLGNLYLKMKQFEEAKEQYIKSLEIDKKHLPAWINLLILIEEQFKCKNFEKIGLEALKYNENNGALHEQMARCYFFTNDKRKAKTYFINAVQLEPQNQLFKMNLNIFYEEEAKLGKNISSN